MFSAQHSKEIDVHFVNDLYQVYFDQRSQEINLRYETRNNSRDLQDR
jgi:hypothetical protein